MTILVLVSVLGALSMILWGWTVVAVWHAPPLPTTTVVLGWRQSPPTVPAQGSLPVAHPVLVLHHQQQQSWAPLSSTTRRRRDSRQFRVLPRQARRTPTQPVDWSNAAMDYNNINNNNHHHHHNNPPPLQQQEPLETASMEALCGYVAEMASLQSPAYFPARAALDRHARLLWIGGAWQVLRDVLHACPDVTVVQMARPLPDQSAVERWQVLQPYTDLILEARSRADTVVVRFVETLPLGLQARTTQETVQVTHATHIVWVLDNDDDDNNNETLLSRQHLTQVVQLRQMMQDLAQASTPHTHIVVWAPGGTPDWREAVLRAAAATAQRSLVFVNNVAALLPALQMQPPDATLFFWKVDDATSQRLLPHAVANNTTGVPSFTTPPLPCASECANDPPDSYCQATPWDAVVNRTRDLTEACTVVVYTAVGDVRVRDLAEIEYQLEDNANDQDDDELICNVALLPQSSVLVQSVIQQVPNANLVQLGVVPQPGDDSHTLHNRKLDKLNGKLLYRGWILVWVDTTWTDAAASLLKLSPGRFWSSDVRYALYTDAKAALTLQDVQFLVHQMQRPAKEEARPAKQGLMHYRLPREPPRRALVLVSEHRLKPKKNSQSKTLTLKRAVSQWEADGTNKTMLLRQAALYDHFDSWINRQRRERRYYKPQHAVPYRYQLTHWASTRWILHDLTHGHDFRCEWYEHVVSTQGSPGLALTHLLAVHEMERRSKFAEPDDHALQHSRRWQFKKAVTDVSEWIPLAWEVNRPFVSSFRYRLDTTLSMAENEEEVPTTTEDTMPVYVRVVSDRVLALARKAFLAGSSTSS